MNIGEIVRRERERRGWSIDDLVGHLGEIKGGDRASVSKIENNQRWPRPATLEAIAKAFGMRVYQLFALAEGVALPVANTDAEEMKLLSRYRVMQEESRYHVTAIVEALLVKDRADGPADG